MPKLKLTFRRFCADHHSPWDASRSEPYYGTGKCAVPTCPRMATQTVRFKVAS